MATTSKDISRAPVAPSPRAGTQGGAVPHPTITSPESLPLGTCGGCEYIRYTAFQGAAPEDDTVWKSPDRRAEEASGEERPRVFRCRHCGRVVEADTPPRIRTIR